MVAVDVIACRFTARDISVQAATNCGANNFGDATMKGWLEKSSAGKKELSLGQVLGKWDRRFCLIDGAILGWHKTEAEAGAVPQGFVEVAECTVTRDTTHQFSVHASDRTLSLRAAAEDEVHRWLVALAGAGCAVGAAARAPLPAEAAVCTALAAQLTMPLAWAAHEGTLRQLWDALRLGHACLLYTSPSPRDKRQSRMPSSA